MSYTIASLMANAVDTDSNEHFISAMAFGNGGAVEDSSSNITYNSPNVDNSYDTLYNQIYLKQIVGETGNEIIVSTGTSNAYADLIITATLDYSENMDQADAVSEGEIVTSPGKFSEIGLVSQAGKLLTHLIFQPVQKTDTRKIKITYTLRITVG